MKKTDIKYEITNQQISRHVPSSARSASQRRYSASSQARCTLLIRSARSSRRSLGFLALILVCSYSKIYFACQVRLVDTEERIFLFSLNYDIGLVRIDLPPHLLSRWQRLVNEPRYVTVKVDPTGSLCQTNTEKINLTI